MVLIVLVKFLNILIFQFLGRYFKNGNIINAIVFPHIVCIKTGLNKIKILVESN